MRHRPSHVAILAVGVAAAMLAVGLTRQLRVRPCAGHVEIVKGAEGVASRVWELPVVATPQLVSERQDTDGCVSYPSSGSSTWAIGPFVMSESWTQGGNDAHEIGPRSVALWVEPIEASAGPWGVPLYASLDYPLVAKTVELRRDARHDVYLLLGAFGLYDPTQEAWKSLLLPVVGRPPGDSSLLGRTYQAMPLRVTYHARGHRRLHSPGEAAIAVGLLAAALFLLRAAARASRLLDCRSGTIDEGGRIMPDDGSAPLGTTLLDRYPPGTSVLFRDAPSLPPTYRTAPAALVDAFPGTHQDVRRRLQRLLGWTIALSLFTIVIASAMTRT